MAEFGQGTRMNRRRKTWSIALVGLYLLSACSPPVPDSGARGPGFDGPTSYQTYSDFSTYRTQRDAELVGAAPRGSTPTTPPGPTATSPSVAADPTLAAAAAALGEPDASMAPGAVAQVNLDNPTISDEQDFGAVSSRETIESDAERLRAQRAAYQQVQPTAVPNRPNNGPNVVAFALSTQHPVGAKVYRRSGLVGQARYERNCAKYPSADLAQEAFLEAGGPDRDRFRIDPDGDGYACAWNPTPYRRAAGAGTG